MTHKDTLTMQLWCSRMVGWYVISSCMDMRRDADLKMRAVLNEAIKLSLVNDIAMSFLEIEA